MPTTVSFSPGLSIPIPTFPSEVTMKGVVSGAGSSSTRRAGLAPTCTRCSCPVGLVVPTPTFPPITASFAVPAGIVTARIDPATGLLAYEGLATAITEQFLDGTEPTETARPPDIIDPSSFLVEATQ